MDAPSRVRLRDICRLQNGFAFDGSKFSRAKGTPLIRIRDLKTNTPSELFDGEYGSDYLVNAGDLLVGMDGEFRCYRWRGPQALLNQRLCRLTPDPARLDADYLALILNAYLKKIESETSFTTVKHISSKQILDIEMPLVPLDVQRRVAKMLDRQMALVERASNRLSEQRSLIEVMREMLIRIELSKYADRPAIVTPLRGLCLTNGQYGLSVKADRDAGGVAILRMGNIQGGRIDWSDLTFVHGELGEYEAYRLKKGDILFNRTNSAELVGKTAVLDEDREAVFASYLIRFRIDPTKALPEFVSFYINSRAGRRFIERSMTRAIGQVNISASTMHEMPIPAPSLEEQHATVATLRKQLALYDEVKRAAEVSTNSIGAISSSLLRQVFGKAA